MNSVAFTSTFRTSKQEHFLVESLLVSTDRQISPHMYSFQDEAEAANYAVFSLHSRKVTKTNR